MLKEIFGQEERSLVGLIRKAFTEIERPPEGKLIVGQSSDASEYELAFRGKDWQELKFEFVYPKFSSMAFFSPVAFRYYLPGYMILCVLHYEDVDMMPTYLLSRLMLPSRNDDFEIKFADVPEAFKKENPFWFKDIPSAISDEELQDEIKNFHEFCDPLNFEQKQAVLAFLDWLVKYQEDEKEDAQMAIGRYWSEVK